MGLEPDQLREALKFPPNLDGSVTTVSVENYRTLQAAARELLALKEAPTHPDYDVALPEIEEWVNDHGNW